LKNYLLELEVCDVHYFALVDLVRDLVVKMNVFGWYGRRAVASSYAALTT